MIMIAAILLGLGDRKREPQSQTRETFGLNEFSQPEKPNKIKIKFKFKCKYKYKSQQFTTNAVQFDSISISFFYFPLQAPSLFQSITPQ